MQKPRGTPRLIPIVVIREHSGGEKGMRGNDVVEVTSVPEEKSLEPDRNPIPEFLEIFKLIQEARKKALRSVNTELINLYWQVGEFICRKVENAEWGSGVVKNLAVYLREKEPDLKGFSAQNLWRMKQFFETYREHEKLSTVLRELPWSSHTKDRIDHNEVKLADSFLTTENGFENQVLGRKGVVPLADSFSTAESECKLVCAPVRHVVADKAEKRREKNNGMVKTPRTSALTTPSGSSGSRNPSVPPALSGLRPNRNSDASHPHSLPRLHLDRSSHSLNAHSSSAVNSSSWSPSYREMIIT